jgi:hypothetical protein
MAVADARLLRDPKEENGKPKRLPAEAMLNIESLEVIARRKQKSSRRGATRYGRCGRTPGYPKVGRAYG